MARSDLRHRAQGPLPLASLALALAAALAIGAGAVEITSDGSEQKPYCSWARTCTWDADSKAECALKLCESSGYLDGIFVSASNDMCDENHVYGAHHFYLVDKDRYFFGWAFMDAAITASCSNPGSVVITTEAPGTEASTSDPDINFEPTTTASPTTTTPPTTTTLEVTTTTPEPTTTTSAVTTTMNTTTVITTTQTSVTVTTTTVTTTPPVINRISGTISAIVSPIAGFCDSNGMLPGLVSNAMLQAMGLSSGDIAIVIPTTCEYVESNLRRLDVEDGDINLDEADGARRLAQGEVEWEFNITAGDVNLSMDMADELEALSLDTLTTLIDSQFGTVFWMSWSCHEATGITAEAHPEGGPIQTTLLWTTSTLTPTSTSTLTATTTTVTTATTTTTVSTTTVTATTVTTTTTFTTTTALFCEGLPPVLNAEDREMCRDLQSGETCEPSCKAMFEILAPVSCSHGNWNITEHCVPRGVAKQKKKGVVLSLSLGSNIVGGLGQGSGKGVTKEWAEENKDEIHESVCKSLGYSLSEIIIEFVVYLRRVVRGDGDDDDDRRRMQDVSTSSIPEGVEMEEVVEMRVTVLLDEDTPDDELLEVSTALQTQLVSGGGASGNATSGGSNIGGFSFLEVLEETLSSTGQSLPEGISVVATSPPSVIQSIFVAALQWLTGSWGNCDAVCGSGVSTRPVECSAGSDLSCTSELGEEKPLVQQECQAFAECPFTVSCPFGQDSSMDCGTQAGVSMGVVGVLSLCTCALCLRRIQVLSRPKSEGRIKIRGFRSGSSLKTRFNVYRPSDPDLSRRGSALSAASKATSQGACLAETDLEAGNPNNEITKDGKVHVVWDLETEKVQSWFAQRGSNLSMAARSSDFDEAGLPRVSSAARLGCGEATPGSAFAMASTSMASDAALSPTNCDDEDFECRLAELSVFVNDSNGEVANPWRSANSPTTSPKKSSRFSMGMSKRRSAFVPLAEVRGGPKLHALFKNEQIVEYFSSTLGKWLRGTVFVTANPSVFEVRYNVTISVSQQQRMNVTAKEMRRPAAPFEKIEIIQSGRWLPGIISEEQPAMATNFGYKVDLESGVTLEDVSAWRVRRRYTVGDEVEVYRGCTEGWLKGTVEAVAEGEGSGEADMALSESNSSGSSGDVTGAAPPADGVRSRLSGLNKASGTAHQRPLDRMWTKVCVRLAGEDPTASNTTASAAGGGDEAGEWFPTYYVR